MPEIGIDCGFFGRDREDVLPIVCVKCRNSSTGCVGLREFVPDCIHRDFGVQENPGETDNERSLLSLIERVTSNLTGVELVLMTSPDGDHAANGLAEVGFREIKARTRILRSQLEQRLGIGSMKRIR